MKSLHRFPVNLNFLITDFSSVDWRPFTDIQYVMNTPVEMYSCRRSTPFARVYTRSRISKNNLCLPTEIQYFRGRDTYSEYKMAGRAFASSIFTSRYTRCSYAKRIRNIFKITVTHTLHPFRKYIISIYLYALEKMSEIRKSEKMKRDTYTSEIN